MRLMNSIFLCLEEKLRCHDIAVERDRLVFEANHNMDSRPGRNRNRQITVSVPITIPVTVCSDQQQGVPAEDLYSIRRKYHSFSSKALARAQYLLTMPRFISWMVEPDSDLLLVDGHCEDQSIGKISPISVLCASLAETLMAAADNDQDTPLGPFANQPQIILFFFCGNHVSLANGSGLVGPEGLIRSLVDQLLAQWPYEELPQISDLSQRTRQFQAHDPDAFLDLGLDDLCFMFEQILGQLGPEYPVCCIIDGVSHFETGLHGWRNDIMYLVECFQGIVSSRLDQDAMNEVASVKVLLVSTDKSMVVRSVVPMDDHLELRAGRMATRSWLRSP